MGINIGFFVSCDQIQKIFGLRELQIKMSLELFHEVPAGATEALFDAQNQLLFKQADSGKYLGIKDIRHNFKDFSSHYTCPRLEIESGGQAPSLGREKNPHDIFINLDNSIEMAVRSKKPKAVSCLNKMANQERRRKNTSRTSTNHHRP